MRFLVIIVKYYLEKSFVNTIAVYKIIIIIKKKIQLNVPFFLCIMIRYGIFLTELIEIENLLKNVPIINKSVYCVTNIKRHLLFADCQLVISWHTQFSGLFLNTSFIHSRMADLFYIKQNILN